MSSAPVTRHHAAGEKSRQHAPRHRFAALDGLRGLAALAVVLYHYTYLFSHLFVEYETPTVAFEFGHYGVQLFFLISGFVIYMTARAGKGVKHFAATRFLRIYPTYFVCLTLACVWSAISHVPSIHTTVVQALVNYTMLARLLRVRMVDGVYWSLVVEILFYCFIAVLLWRFGRLTTRLTVRCALLWMAVGLVVSAAERFTGSRIAQLLNLLTAGQYAGLFVCGIALFLMRSEGEKLGWLAALAAVHAAICEALLADAVGGLVVLLIAAVFAVIALRPDGGFLTWPVLTWLGAISYPLYLIHQNMGYLLLRTIQPTLGANLSALVALAVALTVAWLIHELVEVRFTRWLKPRLLKALHL